MSIAIWLAASLLSAAPKAEAKLVGTWALNGAPFVVLNADGTARMEEEEPLRWSVGAPGTLHFKGPDGEVDAVPFTLQGDTLTLSMAGVPLTLSRAGGKAPRTPQEAATPVGRPAVATAPEKPQAAGNDTLSKLLLSGAWCSFTYNKNTGTSSTNRVTFFRDGTWSNAAAGETYNSGANGTVVGNSASGGGGQWAVKGGTLWMASPDEPQLQPIADFRVTQNSNGWPIIFSLGREYSRCD